MANIFKTNVKVTDIDLAEPNKVRIRSTGLLNTLVHSTPHALEKLAKDIGPVPIDSVYIDDNGRIVITDSDFRSKLQEKIKGFKAGTTAPETNYVCSNAYQCGK